MTRRSGPIFDELTIDPARSRQYDDAEVFKANRMVIRKFFKGIGAE